MILAKLWAKITIQQPVQTVDSVGQPTRSWQDVVTTFADLRHQRGMESVRGDAVTSRVKASIRIRNHPSINFTSGMRVLWDNYIYSVVGVQQQERNRFIDLTCERVTDVQLGD